ncbi:MAG: hypothetical protein AAGD14_03540 [Planctomycetota bacterium]
MAADVSYDTPPVGSETYWFEIPNQHSTDLLTSADPWYSALLPLASQLGEPLEIDAAIDPLLYDSRVELMEWWRFWFPRMHVVDVEVASVRSPGGAVSPRNAQFFSGGLDSWFTLLRHAHDDQPTPVHDLLLGWGLDIPLTDRAAFERAKLALGEVAAKFGKNLVPFATNLRETRLKSVLWGAIVHGNLMAAVTQLLSRTYGRVLIPSSDSYRNLEIWGTHPITDHLYSTTGTRISHEGAAYTRLQKAELIATSDIATANLRVCWKSRSDRNCGKCEKCVRTMVALELCGALDRATSFSHAELRTKDIRRVHCPRVSEGGSRVYYVEMERVARERNRRDLARAMKAAMWRSQLREPILRLAYHDRLSWIGRPMIARFHRTLLA